MRMAQTSGSPQEGQSTAAQDEGGARRAADKTESCHVIKSLEPQAPDDGQKMTCAMPEKLSEDFFSRDKLDAPKGCAGCQGSFCRSLQKAEALLRTRFNPGLKWLPRQKSEEGSWGSEGEDAFRACQNLASRSSRSSARLQHLEQAVLGLSSQCHVLRESAAGGTLRGCVRGLAASASEGDFYHHPHAAAFSRHYAQLWQLLEERAQLLFLQEYAQRVSLAAGFVDTLGTALERARQLLLPERPNSAWSLLGLRALCQELRLHLSHWEQLCAKVRAGGPLLRGSLLRRTEMLEAMRRTLRRLALQALLLVEQCLRTALLALAAARLARVPRDALEDLLSATELFNRLAEEQRARHGTAAWSACAIFLSDWPQLNTRAPRRGPLPAPLPVVQLMRILAERRGRIAAEQLHQWTAQQSELLSAAGSPGSRWEHIELPAPRPPVTQPARSSHNRPEAEAGLAEAIPDEPPKKLPHCPWSSDLPFAAFIRRDREYLEILFQALVFSTDLLSPHVPKRPRPDQANTVDILAESSRRASEGEARLTSRPRLGSQRCRSVQWMDRSKSDACVELFTQYRRALWREFGKALVEHFHHPPHGSPLGSANQWSGQMVFLLVRWLSHACREELIPAECMGAVKGFCTQMLSSAAFLHWDEVMCVSLGSGLKDKCVPGTGVEGSVVRTATMERLLQLFPPLLSALQCLHTSDSSSGDSDTRTSMSLHVGSLSRAVATVQSSTFWVMSKAYQFLASWSLHKFLLVTQGELKVLQASVESLVRQAEAVGGGGGHALISQLTAQLSRGLADLQIFSELVLRIFSVDCKRMSVEIFEQTMPSAKHWRVNYKTELPSNPSQYAASAAQCVIGQVLEGVQPLPDDARVPALTEALTAFMEAWMEHILKQKIKFSLQGALQLKQDFDLIRELLGSEEYSLPEELHQQLLSLRVFHQVDGAIVCLLQQPVAKPYLPSRVWDAVRRCCPNRSRQVGDQMSGSLNNLDSLDVQAACHQALTQAEGSLTPDLLASAPPESYLAAAQQEWLDLRVHSGGRWKLPGLQCLTRPEH